MQNSKFNRNIVDLFAGCGGLSLGMEYAGFRPVFVNELNDDARASYLANRTHEVGGIPFNELTNLHSGDVHELSGKRLGQLKSDLGELGLKIGGDCDDHSIDLLAGGPPCQGYSGIGHRRSYSVDKELLPSNHLYEKMAELIEELHPKAFLFENVRGLLSARWTATGAKGEIWKDVFGRFQKLGREHQYEVKASLVYARDYGVPQNRPRVLIIGFRTDIANAARDLLDLSSESTDAVETGFLPRHGLRQTPDLTDLFSDLVDPEVTGRLLTRDFGAQFATKRYPNPATTELQRFFRPAPLDKKGAPLNEQEYSKHAEKIVQKFLAMQANGGEVPEEFRTKKFAQRLLPRRWGNKGPSITATSLPDDYVHFEQPRSLTVREWARLQTFPDWYEFSGKRTTGGLRRAGNPQAGLHDREVPKYTQIGNAVPVWLAEAVGQHVQSVLKAATG
jgi:DNA (cytosine-5)-methyltransferase 1